MDGLVHFMYQPSSNLLISVHLNNSKAACMAMSWHWSCMLRWAANLKLRERERERDTLSVAFNCYILKIKWERKLHLWFTSVVAVVNVVFGASFSTISLTHSFSIISTFRSALKKVSIIWENSIGRCGYSKVFCFCILCFVFAHYILKLQSHSHNRIISEWMGCWRWKWWRVREF